MLREETIRFDSDQLRKQSPSIHSFPIDVGKSSDSKDSKKLVDSGHHHHSKRKGNLRDFKFRFLFSSGTSLFWIWLSQPQRLLVRSQAFRRMRRESRSIFNATRSSNSRNYFSSLRQYYHLLKKRRLHRIKWYSMHPMHHARTFSRRKARNSVGFKKQASSLSFPPHLDIPSNGGSVAWVDQLKPSSTTPTISLTPLQLSVSSSSSSTPPSASVRETEDRNRRRKHRRKSKTWIPPINSETLHELSISSIFKSIQLRHDLLFDPGLSFRPNLDGNSGREKCKYAQRYWRSVDRAFQSIQTGGGTPDSFDCLRMILTELHKILLSLFSPFASTPARHEPWPWPSHISIDHLSTVFDVDFLVHQIKHGSFCLAPIATTLMDILTPLCPASEITHLALLQHHLLGEQFCKAMCQCFSILEGIKLDCANNVLHRYRSYLINTCTEVELRCFKKQWENGEIKLDSTYNWLRHNWPQQSEKKATFLKIFYQGLLQFVSKDDSARTDGSNQCVAFPITLQFDEKRLTVQLRQDFQSLLLVSIVLIPYRYLAGSFATKSDMVKLKRSCMDLIKDYTNAAGDQTSLTKMHGSSTDHERGGQQDHQSEEDDLLFRLCYRLAYKACYRAFEVHHRHQVAKTRTLMGPDQLCQVSHFWTNWLLVHLSGNSPIYMLAYDRLCSMLLFLSQHGASAIEANTTMMKQLDRLVGIEENILTLGEKLKALADLNLETFGAVYKALTVDILRHHIGP